MLADTMGWLGALYGAADIAFVGGSISKKGGHNFLEAAVFSKPVLFGKYYYNTPEVALKLLSCGGGILVNGENFAPAIKKLFADKEALKRASVAAAESAQSFKGATEKTLKVVKSYERN
jgi:3-deoxy-D-manno-octulosonic-acid transferase